jgi:hypothetical protein
MRRDDEAMTPPPSREPRGQNRDMAAPMAAAPASSARPARAGAGAPGGPRGWGWGGRALTQPAWFEFRDWRTMPPHARQRVSVTWRAMRRERVPCGVGVRTSRRRKGTAGPRPPTPPPWKKMSIRASFHISQTLGSPVESCQDLRAGCLDPTVLRVPFSIQWRMVLESYCVLYREEITDVGTLILK